MLVDYVDLPSSFWVAGTYFELVPVPTSDHHRGVHAYVHEVAIRMASVERLNRDNQEVCRSQNRYPRHKVS